MSIGPSGMGVVSSLAASPLAQQSSSEVTRNQQATRDQSRQVDSAEKAEKAAGIGDADETEKSSDRDADGRRAWEKPKHPAEDSSAEGETAPAPHPAKSKDPSGHRGGNLDISG